MVTVIRLFFLKERFSLFTGRLRLFQDGEYVLFGIIWVFSVLFPATEICLLFVLCRRARWTQASSRAILHWLAITGKWSMMDVFIVALLVVIGKMRGLSEVQAHYGLYIFAAAVVLIHCTAFRLETMGQCDAPLIDDNKRLCGQPRDNQSRVLHC